MIMKVLAYRDTKLNVYSQPFFQADSSKEDIIENVRRMCAGEVPSRLFEYDLYLLGSYDDKLGIFNCGDPEFLVSIGDFKHLAEKKGEENVVC